MIMYNLLILLPLYFFYFSYYSSKYNIFYFNKIIFIIILIKLKTYSSFIQNCYTLENSGNFQFIESLMAT